MGSTTPKVEIEKNRMLELPDKGGVQMVAIRTLVF